MIGRRSFVWAAVSFAAVTADATIAIWPDYAGVTVPTNVAPLNFKIVPEEPGAAASLAAADGDAIAAAVDDCGTARWDARAWRRFLVAHAGEAGRGRRIAFALGPERGGRTCGVERVNPWMDLPPSIHGLVAIHPLTRCDPSIGGRESIH